MLYWKVLYTAGLFGGGVAYLRAYSKDGAIRQCKRNSDVDFKMSSLRRCTREEYERARALPRAEPGMGLAPCRERAKQAHAA